jgi:hypothetical protein
MTTNTLVFYVIFVSCASVQYLLHLKVIDPKSGEWVTRTSLHAISEKNNVCTIISLDVYIN